MQRKSLTELRQLAKELGIKSITKYKKAELILLIEEKQKEEQDKKTVNPEISAEKEVFSETKKAIEENTCAEESDQHEEKKDNWSDAWDCDGVL